MSDSDSLDCIPDTPGSSSLANFTVARGNISSSSEDSVIQDSFTDIRGNRARRRILSCSSSSEDEKEDDSSSVELLEVIAADEVGDKCHGQPDTSPSGSKHVAAVSPILAKTILLPAEPMAEAVGFDMTKKYSLSEIRELEAKLSSKMRQIESNERLLKRSKAALPDHGAKLSTLIVSLNDEASSLKAQILHAKDNPLDENKAAYKVQSKLEVMEGMHVRLKELRQKLMLSGSANEESNYIKDQMKQISLEMMKLEVDSKMKPAPNTAPTIQNELSSLTVPNGAYPMTNLNTLDERLYADGPAMNPLYGGRINQARRMEISAITQDVLSSLHHCLEHMPTEKDEQASPAALKKSIQLFPHQRQALAWMMWRETQKPPGGILADDMGLGKTLSLLCLILKHKELETQQSTQDESWLSKLPKGSVRSGATLVICPASLIGHWEKEAATKVKPGMLQTIVYHGQNRDQSARRLARYELVITTYGTVVSEMKGLLMKSSERKMKLEEMTHVEVESEECSSHSVPLLSVVWERIILDEAHQIRNPKSQTALSVCRLRATRRWVVTGTPIQNRELDMYSLIRFLRVSPFDEYRAWKLWVENKTPIGRQRMQTLIKSMLLRRTKNDTDVKTGKKIVSLPEKQVMEHSICLSKEEREVYDKVFSFSQQAMLNYMRKQQEKQDQDFVFDGSSTAEASTSVVTSASLSKPSKWVGTDIKTHHLLVLLLRLRQICCHPGLIRTMLDAESKANECLGGDEEDDLISRMTDLSVVGRNDEEVKNDLLDNVLDISNPVFEDQRQSTKLEQVMHQLEKLRENNLQTGQMEKAVIVSQWTSMLNIIKSHVQKLGFQVASINGSIPVKQRGQIVEDFNRKNAGAQVMLLSLAAGGVGLNLVGANHLFLLDMHWNPQLEQQACDRIYRVGQERPVTIHKFLCSDTVEVRILDLQRKKLQLADGVLTGAGKASSKLTMDDLKTLFNIK